MTEQERGAHRTLIISNRLPFTVVSKGGRFTFTRSGGGLVSSLASYLASHVDAQGNPNYLWIGWPGVIVNDENRREQLKHTASTEYNSYPVFLSAEETENFYHGFSNGTIWPLFHYFPSYVVYDEKFWEHYERANRIFCDAILECLQPGDIVWIHDYHLMLLPRMLREQAPDVPIGFFLHIPFPSFEMFRLLPSEWRKSIVEGLLGSDLVGFHTHDYTQYYLRSVLRLLGHEHNMGHIRVNNHITRAATFPLGIDYEQFNQALLQPEVKREMAELGQSLQHVKVVLSLDRLDYAKGIINRLQGFELFLEKNSEWRGKVVLALIITPSRTAVKKYKETKREVDELVGRINGRFGNMGWIPVLYQFRSLPFESLTALYGVSDVALITPLRDGMNLVSKEYVATRRDETGVLILSEFAGSAKELGEAVILNPNSREEICEAIKQALEMPREEQITRNSAMRERLRHYTVDQWAEDFINELQATKAEQGKIMSALLSTSARSHLISDYEHANRRLLLLDYDGTLIPFAPRPELATPGLELMDLLARLADDARNEVVLVSGRDRQTMDSWFGDLPVGIVAEHGVWLKEKGGMWGLLKPLTDSWKSNIRPLLESYVRRVPGSFIEEKDYSLVWHYRQADPEQGAARAGELFSQLVSFVANMDVQVLQGNKVIEIKSAGVNKGTAAMHWVFQSDWDFILAIGDDWTDEDLFSALPETSYTLKVGMAQSYARSNIRGHEDVLRLLEELAGT